MTFSTVFVVTLFALTYASNADPSAMDLIQDISTDCLQSFSVSCVKPKALQWLNLVANKSLISITDDLQIHKIGESRSSEPSMSRDIFDKFEDFLQEHTLVAKLPSVFRPGGYLGSLVPRSFQTEDISVPLAATGRSRIIKKVILPFLLGLKFKTAVLVPLILALISLKTWKAFTLGLLSMVLTGALLIFKFTKPKLVNYDVVHYPHHLEHHVDHSSQIGWDHYGHGRKMTAQDMAYSAQ